ncbi:MAG: M48 family metalloprotease [Bacteroidetes bacterium]|nr:M48 family metalloprotease [Bacteroidota bacterium]
MWRIGNYLSVWGCLFFVLSSTGRAQSPSSCLLESLNGSVKRPWLYVENEAISTELKEIFSRIQPHSSYAAPVQLKVAAQVDKFVFAESKGSIVLSIGFIQSCRRKAQLAFVLAHELAHLELRHAYAQSHYSSLSGAEIELEKEADRRALELVNMAGFSSYAAHSAFLIFSPDSLTASSISSRFFPSGVAGTYFAEPEQALAYDGQKEERLAIAERLRLLSGRYAFIPATAEDSLPVPTQFLREANAALIEAYCGSKKPVRALNIWLQDSIQDLRNQHQRLFIACQILHFKNTNRLPMPHGMGDAQLRQLEIIFHGWSSAEVAAWALRHAFDASQYFPNDTLLMTLTESIALQCAHSFKKNWNLFSRKPFDQTKFDAMVDSLGKVRKYTHWPAWKRFTISEQLKNQLESPLWFGADAMLNSDWFAALKSAYAQYTPHRIEDALAWMNGRGNVYPQLQSGTQCLVMNAEMASTSMPSSLQFYTSAGVLVSSSDALTCNERQLLWELCFSIVENPNASVLPIQHLSLLKLRKRLDLRYLALALKEPSGSKLADFPHLEFLPGVPESIEDFPESNSGYWIGFIDLARYSLIYALPLNSNTALRNPWAAVAKKYPFQSK